MDKFREQLTEVFNEWKETNPFITECFKNRDRNRAKKPMEYSFKQFIRALFYGNKMMTDERMVINWKDNLKNLDRLPVNAKERLSFIEEQLDHYQSFIQLSELFSEWEKKSVILFKGKT
ncbi:YpoC family protein [Fictibacillus phosphorivorans]|uniref:YpoC family protein n=1 Tax=Fictibacillus phosphorivorans TaxID=1221500 RepID=UPI00203C8AA9|nr:hypothetical protein [Fictibacillus phosphorivorans]MCM3718895.1 hypothetical protein [Fictibacillus phosphorivorans]MCM3776517.1 hypothetical protein [Fictibacillus phosphorivorans]